MSRARCVSVQSDTRAYMDAGTMHGNGGIAGAVSAVVSQPIDTVKANMMGLEAARFRSSFACAAELVRAGGFLTLFNGVGPRVTRVFIEVGLQFSLYESIGRWLDRVLEKESCSN